ncbi:MAG: iron ABC transporter permease [Woeseiaceae bacterium]|nr:iron ABC transporter permease [Woeseiaceae bacterium]
MPRTIAVFVALVAIALTAIAAALLSGSADLSLAETIAAVTGSAPPAVGALVTELRLPRALTAFAAGGLLAIAGVFMQVLLRNPLAEPYILGTSGGAAVAALLGMLLGWGAGLADAAAFAGAIGAALLVFGIARESGSLSPTRMLLTGVVLAAGFSAITTLILALSPDEQLRGMLFWLMGDLSFAYEPGSLLLLLAACVVAGTLFARHLDVLSRGELQAAILGLPVAAVRVALFAVTALAVAMTVTNVGVIGFVGLVVPHLVRIVAGSAHRIVLPASALAGGSLLVLADTLARSLISPRQLPVGALTAVLGVPLFLLLMRRSAYGGRDPR